MERMNPVRTQEGWIIVDSERRNDDPWVFDDCWHRDQYIVYTVRGTLIRIDQQTNDGIGDTWNRLEDTMRAHGLTGIIEVMGDTVKGLGYRVIHTIHTQDELDAMREAYNATQYQYPYDFDHRD